MQTVYLFGQEGAGPGVFAQQAMGDLLRLSDLVKRLQSGINLAGRRESAKGQGEMLFCPAHAYATGSTATCGSEKSVVTFSMSTASPSRKYAGIGVPFSKRSAGNLKRSHSERRVPEARPRPFSG
jgi:hypothetical protein